MSCARRHYSFSEHDGMSFTDKYRLRGSQWRDHYDRANIAFIFITLLVLFGSCLWSIVAKKQSPVARKTLVWFIPAVVFAIIVFLWTAINLILVEECASVERLFIIFQAIFGSFQFLMNIFLLAAAYTFLIPLTSFGKAALNRRSTSPILAAHLAFCGLLVIFWLVFLSLQLRLDVESTLYVGNDSDEIFNAMGIINFVFDLLYLLACIEVILLATSFLTTCQGRNKQIATIFLIAISIPLFIRSVWDIVLDGMNAFDDYAAALNPRLVFARNIFWYICNIAIYAALAFSISRLEADDEVEAEDFQPAVVEQQTVPRVTGGSVSGWDRASMRDHSQDPIYNGPEMVRDV
ncbi:MAG: hypothetical protein Q9218_006755 [Villophora microphyllina]